MHCNEDAQLFFFFLSPHFDLLFPWEQNLAGLNTNCSHCYYLILFPIPVKCFYLPHYHLNYQQHLCVFCKFCGLTTLTWHHPLIHINSVKIPQDTESVATCQREDSAYGRGEQGGRQGDSESA